MSHYKPYPACKDSGVEWLGKVPEHWEPVPIKTVIAHIESGTSVNAVDSPAINEQIGVLKTSCVYLGEFNPNENKAILPEEYERVSCPVASDTLIVSRMNTPELVGAAGVVHGNHPNLFLPDRLWQVHMREVNPYFVHYWTLTRIYRHQVERACAGTSSSMQNLTQDDFKGFVFPRASLSEQSTIVTHLDRETTRIDTLIAKKTRFIELLKEKRQALITQAVTKGLNPNVKMKDSGVEWLGEVPGHWEVKSIGYVIDAVGDVDHFMPESVERGIPYLMTGDLKERVSLVELEKCKQVSCEDYLKLSRKIKCSMGDVILARYATIGTSMYVDIDIDFLVSYSCVTIKTSSSKVSGLYLFQYLKSDAFYQGIRNQINTNTQDNVGIDDLKKVKMALPSRP